VTNDHVEPLRADLAERLDLALQAITYAMLPGVSAGEWRTARMTMQSLQLAAAYITVVAPDLTAEAAMASCTVHELYALLEEPTVG
jgi:hypothetical protein